MVQTVFLSQKGGRGCQMSSPCLESQGCHLTAFFCLVSCYAVQSLCSLCVFSFPAVGPFPCFPERSSVFTDIQKMGFFVWRYIGGGGGGGGGQLGDNDWSVMCTMLPYGAGVSYESMM